MVKDTMVDLLDQLDDAYRTGNELNIRKMRGSIYDEYSRLHILIDVQRTQIKTMEDAIQNEIINLQSDIKELGKSLPEIDSES